MGLRHPDWLLAAIVLVSFIRASYAQGPEVTIPQGTLLGKYITTRHNRTISGFLGIPYAQPPLGELRFTSPVAAGSWNGTFNASVEASMCPQISDGAVVGDEDCLYINVYTPQLPQNGSTTLLPVLVQIHGGAFRVGSGSPSLVGPGFLLDKDVVLVAMNYRLGALGFLSTGDEVASGNWGLRDTVLALQWVQDNIAYFGGDPTRVTVFGQSAGGAMTQMLSLCNATIGLLHQIITESGGVFMPAWHPKATSAAVAINLGEYFGCLTDTSSNIVACLREINATALVNTNSLYVWEMTDETGIEGALITDTPDNLLVAGQARDIPWIAGVNRDEDALLTSRYFNNLDGFRELMDNIDETIPENVQVTGRYENQTAFVEALKAFYLPDLTANISLLLTNFTSLLNDATLFYPVRKGMEKRLSFAQNPQYFYSFEYTGEYSYAGGRTGNYNVVVHQDELLYLFPQTEALFGEGEVLTTASDLAMVDILVELWTSFATNGTPVTSAFNGTWEPYSSSKLHLRIGDGSDVTIALVQNFHEERIQFWDGLPEITTNTTTTSAAAPIFSNLFLVLMLVAFFKIS